MSIIIFDTETSGLPDKNYNFKNVRLLELGYLKLDEEMNIVKEKNYINKIDIDVPEIITELTGIKKETLLDKGILLPKIFLNFLEDLKDVDVLIAHNNRFDLGIIRQEFKNLGNEKVFEKNIYKKINIDSLQFFRQHIKKKEINNYRLQTIYKYYENNDFIQTHRALDDCHMLYNCLKKISFDPYKYYLEKRFNFKKYPKHSLKDIYYKDKNYVNNFLKNLPLSSKKILKKLSKT